MFGFKYLENIEGREICGRWIYAKNLLKEKGSDPRSELPHVFQEGGERPLAVNHRGKKLGWRERRVYDVMGLVVLHEGEYRRWHSNWGEAPEDCGNEDWQKVNQGVGGIKADHFIW